MSDAVGVLLSAMAWLNLALTLGVAVLAFVKLRATPSGLLLGIAFSLMTVCGAASKVVRMTVFDPENIEDFTAYGDQLIALFWVSSLINAVLWILVAVGIALIPLSLRRLAKRGSPGSAAV